jgi:hypothetical protein
MVDEDERITAGRHRASDNGFELQDVAVGALERDADGFADKACRLRQFQGDRRRAKHHGDAESGS